MALEFQSEDEIYATFDTQHSKFRDKFSFRLEACPTHSNAQPSFAEFDSKAQKPKKSLN